MAFPNVPNVPGVPALPRNPLAGSAAISLLAADAISFLVGLGRPQWGLFLAGFPVVVADNVVSFDFKQDWSISDFPVEQGAFASHDKVNSPFDVKLRFSAGGSEFERQALLDSIAAIGDSLQLFDAVTPEATYQSVNVTHYDYRRTASGGLGLLVVDVWCTQVRVTAQSAFSNTQAPSGANPVSGGTVQTQAPTPAQASASSSVN